MISKEIIALRGELRETHIEIIDSGLKGHASEPYLYTPERFEEALADEANGGYTNVVVLEPNEQEFHDRLEDQCRGVLLYDCGQWMDPPEVVDDLAYLVNNTGASPDRRAKIYDAGDALGRALLGDSIREIERTLIQLNRILMEG
jgi:hypothetical protein